MRGVEGARPGEIGEGPGHHLIVTEHRAYELEDASSRDGTVFGKIVHRWTVDSETRDISALQDLDPPAIAATLGWIPDDLVGNLEVSVSDIRSVRSWEDNSGKVGAAIGIPVGLTLLLGVLAVAALASACGRPLRVRGRQCITPVASSTDWIDPVDVAEVPPSARATLAAIWTEEAQAEHAAVAAFAKLSLELIALGAPPDLVIRAHRAALQEVQHARLCFGVASAYTGRQLGPGPLPQALEGDTVDINRIAREALVDGCLREGLAGEIAARGASTAVDPALARVMRIQAREEAQHADLGWAIVEWCLVSGGDTMRDALLAAMKDSRLPRCDDLPEHGRVPRHIVAPMHEALLERTRSRLCAFEIQTALAA